MPLINKNTDKTPQDKKNKNLNKKCMGIIIDAAEIIAVEVAGTQNSFKILGKDKIFLPKNLVENGFITDIEKFGLIYNKMVTENKFSAPSAVLAAKNQNVLMRISAFPKAPDDKMKNVVIYGAQQVLPIPVVELNLDCVICDEFNEDSRAMVNALIVGAKKTSIKNMINFSDYCNFTLSGIDAAPLCAVRGLSEGYTNNQPTLIVYFDYEMINMLVVENKTILMSRTVAFTEYAYIKEIERMETLEPSQYWLQVIDIDVLSSQLISDIKTSIMFFENQKKKPISSILLCGENVNTEKIKNKIKDSFTVDISLGVQYENVLTLDEQEYAAAVSLAISGLEE